MLRTELVTDGRHIVKGVVGFCYDYDYDPKRLAPDVNLSVRSYAERQFYLVYNRAIARWQIVAQYKDTLRLVKTWQDSAGNFLPLSMKMYDWLVSTGADYVFGTRDADKIDRVLRNEQEEFNQREDAKIASDLEHFKRDNRHVLNRLHADWQKKYAFDDAFLYPDPVLTARKQGRRNL